MGNQLPPPPGCAPSNLRITKVFDSSGTVFTSPCPPVMNLKAGTITAEYTIDAGWVTDAYILDAPLSGLPTTTNPSPALPGDPPPPPLKYVWRDYQIIDSNQKLHINADCIQGSDFCHDFVEVTINVSAGTLPPPTDKPPPPHTLK